MKRHIPNLLTLCNLLTGAAGCVIVLQGKPQLALYFVLIAAVFDFFDGFAARLLKVQSAIGKELDSLADMVSFGVLPALFVVSILQAEMGDQNLLPLIGLIIAAFSALRLAKFNIDDRQSDGFIGVPTPANAIMLTSLVLLPGGFLPTPQILIGISIIASLMLVMNVPMIALKFKGISWSYNKWKYILIIAIVILIAIFQSKSLPFVIPVYILISLIRNFTTHKEV